MVFWGGSFFGGGGGFGIIPKKNSRTEKIQEKLKISCTTNLLRKKSSKLREQQSKIFKNVIQEDSEEVGQAISELSRELSTNEIALFSIVFSAEFGQKNLYSTENKSRKNINIKIFLQNFKCSSTTAKDLVISAKISEVNVIFNVILMFEVRRLPATC